MKKQSEHYIFLGLAIWFGIITFLGFSKSIADPERTIPLRAAVHGGIYSCWILLLIVQAILIQSNRRKLHRRLGVFGFLIILAMLPSGLYTVLFNVYSGKESFGVGGADSLKIILSFTLLMVGISQRKNPYKHKRLMILGTMPLMSAAINRIFFYYFGIGENILIMLVLILLPAIVLVSYDLFSRKSIYTMNVVAMSLLVIILFSEPFWSSQTGRNMMTSIIPIKNIEIGTLGIIGSALETGWTESVPMNRKTPSSNFWVLEQHLGSGEIKFRADDDWQWNWGGNGTSGELIRNGANIQVAEGNYYIEVDLARRAFQFSKQ